MSIYITGSLAYDRIMTFPGIFGDYIIPDKIHMLNICFHIDHVEEKRGGTGGNIAYNLALLGESSVLLCCAGKDFAPYRAFLEKIGVNLTAVRVLEDEYTASCYITTDKNANQITAFHGAAMYRQCGYTFPALDPQADIAVISPTSPDDMAAHAALYKARGVRYIYDPGQQLPTLKPGDIAAGIGGAALLVSNDYELELIKQMTGLDEAGLLELTPLIITTLGGQGSRILRRGRGPEQIKAARLQRLTNPTGAGDAYRAGLLKGMLHGLAIEEAVALGSVCAAFCVEEHGTQEHRFTPAILAGRLWENYGLKLPFL